MLYHEMGVAIGGLEITKRTEGTRISLYLMRVVFS